MSKNKTSMQYPLSPITAISRAQNCFPSIVCFKGKNIWPLITDVPTPTLPNLNELSNILGMMTVCVDELV